MIGAYVAATPTLVPLLPFRYQYATPCEFHYDMETLTECAPISAPNILNVKILRLNAARKNPSRSGSAPRTL